MKHVWLALSLAASLLLAQQASKDKGKASDQKKEPPKEESGGLFKNKLGYESSKQSKDSTTLGFNGIDPSGKIDKAMMAKSPTAAHVTLVAKMTADRPTDAALKAFLQEGALN